MGFGIATRGLMKESRWIAPTLTSKTRGAIIIMRPLSRCVTCSATTWISIPRQKYTAKAQMLLRSTHLLLDGCKMAFRSMDRTAIPLPPTRRAVCAGRFQGLLLAMVQTALPILQPLDDTL